MKKLIYLIFLFIISCSKYNDGYNDPCSNQTKFNKIKDKFIGTLPFSDTTLKWVYFDTIKPIRFVNSNGFKTVFTFNNIKNDYEEQSVYDRDSIGGSPCYSFYDIYNYGNFKKQSFNYSADNISINFNYFRYNKIIKKSEDSLSTLLGLDYLKININDVSFEFPFNKPEIKNYAYLDSIQLGANYYKNVFEIYTDKSLIDSSIIKPIGLYYNLNIGLIGFYLNNGEKWWRY